MSNLLKITNNKKECSQWDFEVIFYCALCAHHSSHLYYCAIIDFHAFLTKEGEELAMASKSIM